MIAAIFTASVIAYLVVGWRIARRMLPRFIESERARYFRVIGDSMPDWWVVSNAKEFVVLVVLLWPVAIPWHVFNQSVQSLVDQSDPARMRKRIAELEKELGMGADK